MPLKGRDIIIYFNYTNATPALRELQLWPELVSVGMSAPSNVALTGWPVTLEGNVTVKEWTDDRGNIAHCVYQWNGSCIGCAGSGCDEGEKGYPGIGMPTWGLIPMPRSWMNAVNSVFSGFSKVTGLTMSPPKLTLPMPTLTFSQDYSPSVSQQAEKAISPEVQKQIDENNKNASAKLDEANKAVAPIVTAVTSAYSKVQAMRSNVDSAYNSANKVPQYLRWLVHLSDYETVKLSVDNAITSLDEARDAAYKAESAAKAALDSAKALSRAIANDPGAVAQLGSDLRSKIAEASSKRDTAIESLNSAKSSVQGAVSALGKLRTNETNVQTALNTAKAYMTAADSAISAVGANMTNPFATISTRDIESAQTAATQASVYKGTANSLKRDISTGSIWSKLGLRWDTVVSAIAVGLLHGWLTEQWADENPVVQRVLQVWFAVGYMLAMNEALENAAVQCYNTSSFLRFCNIDMYVFTWWTLDSLTEPDPDGAGDYSYYLDTCESPTGFDEYMANAGVWAFFSPIFDVISNLTMSSEATRAAAANQEIGKTTTCDACVAGIRQGAVTLTPAQAQELIEKCKEKFSNSTPAYKVCAEVSGRTARGVAQGTPCGANEIAIFTADGCDSQINAALAGQGDALAGKWCAKKIRLNTSAVPPGQPVEEAQVNDTTYLTAYGNVAKCVLKDSACPTGMEELARCEDGRSAANVSRALSEQAAAAIGKCEDCEAKRYHWCANLITQDNKITDMKGSCVVNSGYCESPNVVMSCAKYNNLVKTFVTAPAPPPPSAGNRCRATVEYYQDLPNVAIGFCYDPNAPSGGTTAYMVDCKPPKVYVGKNNISQCDVWARLNALGGLDGILQRAQTLKAQLDAEVNSITLIQEGQRTQQQKERLKQLQSLQTAVNEIIDNITTRRITAVAADLETLQKAITEIERTSGRGNLPAPAADWKSRIAEINNKLAEGDVIVDLGHGNVVYTYLGNGQWSAVQQRRYDSFDIFKYIEEVPVFSFCYQPKGNQQLCFDTIAQFADYLLGPARSSTGAVTASSISQLGEIPPAPTGAPSFGLPVTGTGTMSGAEAAGAGGSAAWPLESASAPAIPAQSYPPTSSFGPLPATGEQLGGVATGAPPRNAVELLARMQQTQFTFTVLQKLSEGETIYRRQFVVQPSLGNASLQKCPAVDDVFGRKRPTSPKGLSEIAKVPTAATLYETVTEPWPYITMERPPEPLVTDVNVTVYNATGSPVASWSVPSNASGYAGYFRTSWTPAAPGTYYIEAKAGAVSSPARLVLNAVPHPVPLYSVEPSVVCTKPGVPQSSVLLTVNEPDAPIATTSYNLSVCKWVGASCVGDAQIGVLGINASTGNATIIRSMVLDIDSNSSFTARVGSNVSSTTTIAVRMRNATFGIALEKNFTHIVVSEPWIKLSALNPVTSQQAFVQNVFTLNLTNGVPRGCAPTTFSLVTEPPSTAGWTVELNGTADVIGGNSTLVDVSITPVAPPGMGRWPTYVLASSSAPLRLGTATDAIAVAADERFIYYTSTDSRLKRFDAMSGQAVGEGFNIGSSPGGVAVDANYIYYAAGGTISRAPKAGAWSPTIVASGVTSAGSQLAVDGTHVWWLEKLEFGSRIKRAPKAGSATDCSADKCVWMIVNASDIAVDANYLYWTEGGQVMRMPKTVGSAAPLFIRKRASTLAVAEGGGGTVLYAGIGDELGKAKVVRIAGNGTDDEPLSAWPAKDYAYAIARNPASDIALGATSAAAAGKLVWIEDGSLWAADRDALTDWDTLWYEYCTTCSPIVTVTPLNAPVGTQAAMAPPGEVATYVVNITNTVGVAVPNWTLSITPPPSGWSANLSAYSVDLEAAGTPGDSASVYAYVTSPETISVGTSWGFVVSASKAGVSGSASSAYIVAVHNRPGISAVLIDPADAVARPGSVVGWNVTVRNNDPLEFARPANITLSVVASTLPEGWSAWWQIAGDPARYDNVTLAVMPTATNGSAKFYAQSLKRSPDGPHAIRLRASAEGVENWTDVTYNIVGCGNMLCEPERGEYDKTGPKWCAADCSQGWDNFKCTFVGQAEGRTWLECDKTRENATDFGLELAVPGFAQLADKAMRVCQRGKSIAECVAAPVATCGLTRIGTAGAMASCIAGMDMIGAGAQGPSWAGRLACPTDYEGDYYLLFQGTTTTTVNLTPVGVRQNWTSANFSYACPDYRLGELGATHQFWQGLHTACLEQLQNIIGQLGVTSDCAQKQRQVCEMRQRHIANISAVIAEPSATAARRVREATTVIENQIAALLASGCFKIPVLAITSIRPPKTLVGEVSPIMLTINNTQDADYRGYVACSLKLPDGSSRTERSACSIMKALNATDIHVPVYLTQAGNWSIESCTVFAGFASMVGADCANAPEFFTEPAAISFTVGPAVATLWSPKPNATLSGSVLINATVSGTFDSIGWSYSPTSPACAGGPTANMSAVGAGFTRTYTATWDTTAVADRGWWLCVLGRMGAHTANIVSVPVVTDNYRFTLNPSDAEVAAAARATKTLGLMLSNDGTAADDYAIGCSAPAGWTTTMSSGTASAACGQSMGIHLEAGESVTIAVSVAVPGVDIGAKATINVTASNSQGDALVAAARLTVAEVANDPPRATNISVTPNATALGGTVTFSAAVTDPNGDPIASVRACADRACASVLCNMTGTTMRSCSWLTSSLTGIKRWWVHAEDSLGLASTTEGPRFAVLGAGESAAAVGGGDVQAGACPLAEGYGCFATCQPNPAYCVNRTSYGQLDCQAGQVCCKEIPIANCVPVAACSISIESKNCIWDPVAQNYSVNVQASWSGGAYARISAAGVTSGPISNKSAVFNARTAAGGSKGIWASVYSPTDATLCTNSSAVTCVSPDEAPPASPIGGALPVSVARASSFIAGSEPGKAVDGDQFTAWNAQPGFPQWLKLDLGMPKAISGVGIYSTQGRPRNFTIDISTNDVSWSRVATVRNAAYTNDWTTAQFGATDARYVLLNITGADAPVLAYEVEVYPGAPLFAAPTAPAEGVPWLLIAILLAVAAAVAALLYIYHERLRLWWSYVRG
ncbi:MAG: discoidin domain-containing protein [Candidatus Aenigmatarchaeota archaeon]